MSTSGPQEKKKRIVFETIVSFYETSTGDFLDLAPNCRVFGSGVASLSALVRQIFQNYFQEKNKPSEALWIRVYFLIILRIFHADQRTRKNHFDCG